MVQPHKLNACMMVATLDDAQNYSKVQSQIVLLVEYFLGSLLSLGLL